ncbi:response regulator transcription factor [Lachnoclostridium phytofermentans]|uniref:Stage 0 sporulation protein A homolog n=1 Tax=Lachnoclostridium phytofermentans (strain ATCC 700394 / DSM 18823 / ISDg) TaxID=357809 RepID=A9KM61_LACP7|nr:response regulator transcription factor [Lachnoclostridium phytofermentans]ABX41404.1 two component transcriptional regulator, winged helix family [Lachnoclostridium phytofermentans ISDg]
MTYTCLVVDDEKELAIATCEYFNMFGVSAAYVTNKQDCLKFLKEHEVKLILLDINLQEDSGFLLCKEIREFSDIPIFFISARQSDDDILMALNIGGDDYIKKPYALSVLLAKVKVVLKRLEDTKERLPMQSGRIRVDVKARKVYVEDMEIELKNKEFKLFLYLFQHPNIVITKDELFANVWGDAFFSDGTLNVHIRKLREKIEKDPNNPEIIKTIWGTGYRMEL